VKGTAKQDSPERVDKPAPGQFRSGLVQGGLTIAQMEAHIVRLLEERAQIDADLKALYKIRRARLGAVASLSRPRGRRFTDRQIEEAYEAAGGGRYGAVRRTAAALGCSEQTVQRWLQSRRQAASGSPTSSPSAASSVSQFVSQSVCSQASPESQGASALDGAEFGGMRSED
jgi:hypothetical protein